MPREMIFRAKDYLTDKWLYGSLISLDPKSDQVYICEPFTQASTLSPLALVHINSRWVNKNTVGQYTGLKDKNLKMIFEGDIVEFDGNRYEIVFDCSECRFMMTRKKSYNCVLGEWRILKIEVIGNIYDNPMLMEESNEENIQ